VVNITHLDLSPGLNDASGQPKRAVFVLSAGYDGIIDTPFEQSAGEAQIRGDDIGCRLQ